MGSEIHYFSKTVGLSPGFGVPVDPLAWEVRDVTSGVTVAKGVGVDVTAANTAATSALAAEKTRLQAIVNPFALDSAAAITAAYAALPA